MVNLLVSILVFGSGLILFFKFHVGDGAHRRELFGLEKGLWLGIHQVTAIGLLVCVLVHIQRHLKHIKTVARRWRASLPKKTRSTTREQALLLVAFLVVMWAGLYAWIAFPNATLENREFHCWIDAHNIIGLLFLIGMSVHIKRRWQRILTPRGGAARPDVPCEENRLTWGENAS
jgi:hypothetical protein